MGKSCVVAGTGFEGRDKIIKAHCKEGAEITLKREPTNKHDSNAIAVYLHTPRLFGLLGTAKKQIGYIKARAAKPLAEKMDSGVVVTAQVASFYAPDQIEHPRVTVEVDETA